MYKFFFLIVFLSLPLQIYYFLSESILVNKKQQLGDPTLPGKPGITKERPPTLEEK